MSLGAGIAIGVPATALIISIATIIIKAVGGHGNTMEQKEVETCAHHGVLEEHMRSTRAGIEKIEGALNGPNGLVALMEVLRNETHKQGKQISELYQLDRDSRL